MSQYLKKRLHAISPRWLSAVRGRCLPFRHNRWTGDFSSWAEATKISSGYADDRILIKVRETARVVKDGDCSFERDSVLFEKSEMAWPLVASLTRVAAENHNCLDVLDFGGSLGSTYFQHRRYFDWLKRLTWCVVEQTHFVACGREEFQSDALRFFASIDECLAEHSPNVALFMSTLPYLKDPYAVLQDVIASSIPYFFIDRTPYLVGDDGDRLTVQTVPPSIYPASYPAWFFDYGKLMGVFEQDFSLIIEFQAEEGEVVLEDPPGRARFAGWLFKRN